MKGLGYSLEVIAAIFVLIAFAATGFQIPQASQDWRDYQHQVATDDFSYTLRNSGHLQHFLKNREFGGLRTATQTVTERDLKVSGSVSNLPLKEMTLGFNTMPDRIHTQQLEPVTSGDYCHGDLEEIERRSNTDTILKTQDVDRADHHDITLYFADTDPRDPSGDDGDTNYDSVWVDNGTRCQFGGDEGPYYTDQFFYWAGGSNDLHYELESVDGTNEEATVYEAEQVINFRKTMSERVNGVDTAVSYDTFRYDQHPIANYDVVVFRRDDSLSWINADYTKLEDFMEAGSAMLLMDLDSGDFQGGFLPRTGLRWMDLGFETGSTSTEGTVTFSKSTTGREVETFFAGQGGQNSKTSMKPDGKVSSSRTETLASDEMMAYTFDVMYDTDEWDAADMSMSPGSDLGGVPQSDCGEHYNSDITFPATGNTYNVVVTHLGVCKNVYGLSIDHSPANGQVDDQDVEGPFLNGEEVVIDGRTYRVRLYPTYPNAGELEYAGPQKVEVVNYRKSFPEFEGQRLVRAGYENNYEEHDRKVLASAMYWLRGDKIDFSAQGDPVGTTTITGGIAEKLYMPYRVDLRWKR